MTADAREAVCCADLGGSWLRLAVRCPGRKALLRMRSPYRLGSSPRLAVRRALARLGLRRVGLLLIGARGCWLPAEKSAMRRKLSPFALRVIALSDIELAHLAAFQGGPGTLIVGGTGSAGYGRDAQGRSWRTGGLGPLLGDEGSAFWIGRRWLSALEEPRTLGYAKRPDAVRAVASLARTVLRRARRDAHARAIVREAAEALASLARRTASRLRMKGRVPLSCNGGLFKDPLFLKEFIRALDKKKPACAPRLPLRPNEEAAALLPEEILLRWDA
ncbi:MAG: BadF/BadG/BcrA/BcrD ATPase family protein [Elusimicrobiota bacterium]|jgi:N-acetylglucosamine kinase-like BadF-type ATPase